MRKFGMLGPVEKKRLHNLTEENPDQMNTSIDDNDGAKNNLYEETVAWMQYNSSAATFAEKIEKYKQVCDMRINFFRTSTFADVVLQWGILKGKSCHL